MTFHMQRTLFLHLTLAAICTSACQSPDVHSSTDPTQNNPTTEAARAAWWSQFSAATNATNQGADPSFQNLASGNIYQGCGYDPEATPNIQLVSDNYNSTGVLMAGSNWQVFGDSTLGLAGGLMGFGATTQFTIKSGRPAAAVQRAQSYSTLYSNAAAFAGDTPADVQVSLGRTSRNPSCGVLVTHQNKMNSADGKTWVNVLYDKAVPYFISPIITQARLNYEMQQGLSVSNVTATIESNDPDVANETRTGTVAIMQIPASKVVIDSLNNPTVINADFAYRVLSQFTPSSSGTAIPWLDQVTDYYVKSGHIITVVVQIPRPDLNIVVNNIVPPAL